MQPNILLRRVPLNVALAGLALFVALMFHFIAQHANVSVGSYDASSSAPMSANATAFSGKEETTLAMPVRIKIPKINVDAAVEQTGVTPDGAMDIPKNPDDVAWFNLGPSPGEKGSAVIAGHYGWKGGKASVFDNLYKLRKGDKLYIEDEKGAMTAFVVSGTRRYDPNANTADVFGSHDGKAHLNLITCEGVWNKTEQSYSRRLVVFTDKE